MGKTVEQMSGLSNILNNTKESHVSIDDIPTEIKKVGRPRKKIQQYNTWCGLKTPEEIYLVCIYLKELLEDQGKYTKALDIQIFNASVQFFLYNELIKKMVEGKEVVPVRALTTTSESFRRALQSLGLTVMDKKSGVTKEQTETNPLAVFLGGIEELKEEVVVKKPKRKK